MVLVVVLPEAVVVRMVDLQLLEVHMVEVVVLV